VVFLAFNGYSCSMDVEVKGVTVAPFGFLLDMLKFQYEVVDHVLSKVESSTTG